MAKDLTDTPPEADEATDVAIRNGSPGALEELEEDEDHEDHEEAEYALVETVPSTPVREHTFLVRHAHPYVSPSRSARNHWHLVAVFALLGVLLGAAIGFVRPVTYTAESRLVVGKTAQLSNLASIPGLDAAGQSLASSYSRLVDTDAVLNGTAKRLGGTIDGGLSASPIPLSPIVRLEATSSSSEGAVALAKAGAAALVDAVNRLNVQQSKAADDLLKQYQDADAALLAAQNNLTILKAQLATQFSDALQTKVNIAQTEVDAEQVKTLALANTFNGVFSPTALNTQILQPVGTAAATGDNRKSTLELGLLVGLVGGGLLGLGLAVWIDLRARARQ